ncbi:MAG: M15 family metallopeptidase [Lachnospiraceae bacterium]|nr:M15 family metallopeptidase [Lachnospiraceae bacterium]
MDKEKSQVKIKKGFRRVLSIILYISITAALGLYSFMLGEKLGREEGVSQFQIQFPDELEIFPDEEENTEEDEEEIILVNRDNPLPEDYEVTLYTLPDGVNRAAEEAYAPLCQMLAEGRKEGLNFEICSSYRDMQRQQELFDEDVEELMKAGFSYEEAYEEAARETMLPGCSEHSTGLAFDIVALSYQLLDAGQEKTAENIWLQEHCAEYGFILRYPKGKEEITSINYESWHFRYVGVEAAMYMTENGLTLEEYLSMEET